MSLIKRKDSQYWYVSFVMQGKQYTKSSKSKSKAVAAAVEQKYKNEIHRRLMLGDKKPVTIEKAISSFLSTSTNKAYVSGSDKLLGFVWNRKHTVRTEVPGLNPKGFLHDISRADITKILNHRNNVYKPATVQLEMVVLRLVIEHAGDMDWRTPDVKVPYIKVPLSRFRYLSDVEEKLLLDECKLSTSKDLHDLVVMLLDTGVRSVELKTLAWSSIDMEKRTIDVYRSKTKTNTTLPMTKRVRKLLKMRLKESTGLYVFAARYNNKEHVKYFRHSFNAACDRAGINDPAIVGTKGSRIVLHSLRHSFCTNLIRAGMSLYAVSKLAGHARSETTARYSHLAPDDVHTQMLKILNK